MSSSSITSSLNHNATGEGGTEIKDDKNVLRKHVEFFDINKDGIIYPWETFKGFRAIGSGLALSAFASLFINMGLSSKTTPLGKKWSPSFPIYVENIKLAKHGSDSGVYDVEGRFVASKFDDIFRKHALTNANALTPKELSAMLKANREPKDYKGWIAAWSEWKILYYLCKGKDGLLHKETVRAVYDGSLFEKMAKENASSRKSC